MKKLEALRARIVAALPELQRTPERLLTFVDDGRIAWRAGTNYDHRYRYECQIIITDYSGEIDALVVPILHWMAVYNPDVPIDDALRFEAEILANDRYDLHLFVTLDERVRARTDCDTGRIETTHLMPAQNNPAACGPGHWQLYIRDGVAADDYRLLAEWDVVRDGDG